MTDIPSVRAHEMRRADDLAESKYSLDLLQMMENAGLQLARLVRDHCVSGQLGSADIVVLAGPGGNGGGGLAAARRLSTWGARVQVSLSASEDQLRSTTRKQLRAAQAAGIEVLQTVESAADPDAIVDSYLGYSRKGAPRPPMDRGINWANSANAPVIALDVPSGLDPDEGDPAEPTVKAAMTLTLALPKTGLLVPAAEPYVGELWLADISLPPQLFADLGVEVPVDLFRDGELINLHA